MALVRTPTRFYEPGIGRFISVDPARQGWTPYKYGRDNPAVWLDPDGRSPTIGTLSDNLAIAEQPLFYQLHNFPSSTRVRDAHQARGVRLQEEEEGYLTALKKIVSSDKAGFQLATYKKVYDFAYSPSGMNQISTHEDQGGSQLDFGFISECSQKNARLPRIVYSRCINILK